MQVCCRIVSRHRRNTHGLQSGEAHRIYRVRIGDAHIVDLLDHLFRPLVQTPGKEHENSEQENEKNRADETLSDAQPKSRLGISDFVAGLFGIIAIEFSSLRGNRCVQKTLKELARLIAIALQLCRAITDIVKRSQVRVLWLCAMLDFERLDELDFLSLVQRVGNDPQGILAFSTRTE